MKYLPSRPDRIVVMGVLNVTPDSFSDGGRYASVDDAVAHGVQMRAEGADLIDVGGESTRPGAQRVEAAEEIRRVLPVVKALAALGIATSVDTYRASVASVILSTMPARTSCCRRLERSVGDIRGTPRRSSLNRPLPLTSSRTMSSVHRSSSNSIAFATGQNWWYEAPIGAL